MAISELSLSVTTFNGAPLVTARGTVDTWQIEAIEDIVAAFPLDGTAALTLDFSQASFADVESLAGLIRLLRGASAEMQVTAVTAAGIAAMLRCAGLEHQMTICTSIDAATSVERSEPDYLASQLTVEKADKKLPLAA